jgi:DeoR/GlpR family transcriptional regulator of sugar metabolism
MAINPRHSSILNLLQNFRQMSVAELTERLGVSQVTIRKDLSRLEELGLVQRSHGGARLAQSVTGMPSVSDREREHHAEKERIANRALELIQDGDSVCIDAGSTNSLLARHLRDLPLRVVTNSLDIVNALADAESISLSNLGGSFRREAGSFIGPMTIEALKNLRFDIAFVGATGFTAEGDFLTQNTIEGSVKRAILEASQRRVILADSSKFEARAFAKFASAELVDVLITDQRFEHGDLLRQQGIEVIIV